MPEQSRKHMILCDTKGMPVTVTVTVPAGRVGPRSMCPSNDAVTRSCQCKLDQRLVAAPKWR